MKPTSKQFNFMRLASAVAVGVALGAAASTGAASTASTFKVEANVNAQCTVTAADLNFGNVDPLGGNVDQSTTITVKCTKNSAYTIGLNAGTVLGSLIGDRLMTNGADVMRYQLYTDTARSLVWGNSTGLWVSGVGAGMGTGQALTVYGRVPTGQTNLAVGGYSEPTLTVTVTY